jgi:aspartate carbamoyltransferase catalytic subunit
VKKIWPHKDLCALADHTEQELRIILDTATAFKGVGERNLKKVPALRGKTLVNLFVEPSTRTRISFELAAMRLSADVVNISASASSLEKGESLLDTARNLEALRVDLIVIRHKSAGSARFLADRLKASIINAGDGAHEHPTQGLLDAFTIREKLGTLEGVRISIVGDILFSRVARSNIDILTKLGAKVTLVGPPTLVPETFLSLGVRIAHSIDEVIEESDVINLLRIQHERQHKEYFPGTGEYTARFGLTRKRAERLRPNCLIMHPGPMNRGVEIDSDVADGQRSVILDQVTNGLAIRMAVLYLCSGGSPLSPNSVS